MSLHMAAVVLPTWQWVLLMSLCFGSLTIALYCLLFMVPLKSFVQKVNSLGGGMEGIRKYVDGLRSETEKRIASVQGHLQQELEQTRAEFRGAMDALTQSTRQAQSGIQKLDGEVQGLQTELRGTVSEMGEMSAGLGKIHKQLGELRNDFDVLQVELRGSVQQLVSDSYQQIEGTVLSALEAVKDEMLRGAGKLQASRDPGPTLRPASPRPLVGPRYKPSRRRPSSKIISAEPLFANLEKVEKGPAKDGGEKGGGRTMKGEPAPAK